MVSTINHKNIGAYSLGSVRDGASNDAVANRGSDQVSGCHDDIEAACPLPVPMPAAPGRPLSRPSS